jgi:hypothetical protein
MWETPQPQNAKSGKLEVLNLFFWSWKNGRKNFVVSFAFEARFYGN